MQIAKAVKIIDEIIKMIEIPNEKEPKHFSIDFFTYEGDKPELIGKQIVLTGDVKVWQYNKLYRDLYKEVNAQSNKISFKYFKSGTQQLLFTNDFNFDSIIKFLNNLKTRQYFNAAPIWGTSLKEDFVNFGKFAFVNKQYIKSYIQQNVSLTDDKYTNYSIDEIEKLSKNKSPFVFLVSSYDTHDSVFAYDLFLRDKTSVINTLRYMLGLNKKRIYIDDKEFIPYIEKQIQFTESDLLTGTKTNTKDIEVLLDEDYYYSETNGNKQIWDILSKDIKSDLENRIINSVQWVGRSLNEQVGNDISITELAFAFETLLKENEQISPTTASIQGSISEAVAYMVNDSLEERLSTVKRFTDFYHKRSAVVHGGIIEMDVNMYYEFLNKHKLLVKKLLTDEKYKSINKIKELYQLLKNYKFRT